MAEAVTLGGGKDIHNGLVMGRDRPLFQGWEEQSNAVEGQPVGAGKWALHAKDVCILLS